ncbi:type II pantothenate kinase [Paenibacillus agricola]|uniref:Type II pantothenate kinase n=1 Tax=Paenibacillus agricola TaxID=2716264 RepID=A0ABX0J424_9BACL|nr:type II pantothenate kinase [Paenibacillus agricola]NHN30576.1 type II pantothenate kinase [Paenibacillus agricola]
MEKYNSVGVDAGGTLIKIAYRNDQQELSFEKFPVSEIAMAAAWIQEHFAGAEICVTGGKAKQLHDLLNRPIRTLVEFDATCNGVQYLMDMQKLSDEPFVLTNVGTGTSIHFVDKQKHHRLGGIGVGGGTLMGLSFLLTGIQNYAEIVEVSRQGNRKFIDLKVSDIYEGMVPPIPGDLTASNFGNVLQHQTTRQNSDILASVIGLVGETITTISVQAATQNGASSIVYIGSSFIGNDVLRDTVVNYTVLRGAVPTVLRNGEYSGAIGALMS